MDPTTEASFKAVIAQHLTESAAASASEPMNVDSPVPTLAEQKDLERIAEHVRQDRVDSEAAAAAALSGAEAAASSSSSSSHPAAQQQESIEQAATADLESTLATVPITTEGDATTTTKLIPGTDAWHKMRRDNHKEVERRRRENINHGISDLSIAIECTEKNKGQILRDAVKYIENIKQAHAKLSEEVQTIHGLKVELANLQLDKQVAEGALESLSMSHAQLKREYEQLKVRQQEMKDEEEKDDEGLARKKIRTD
ncbi:basic helix-loop-helix protein [Podila humilis]|nr:basic helix-loop-helix protein [Podila humilis]